MEPLPPLDERDPNKPTTPRVQLLAVVSTLLAVPVILIALFLLVAILI